MTERSSMIKNVYTSTSIGNGTSKEMTEYKIGHTTYKVVTKFNFSGDNLKDILVRLIKKRSSKDSINLI